MSPSRRTSTRAAVPSRRCWSSPARCTSATRSSPARPTAASARCSTSTASRSSEAGPSRPVLVLGLTSVPGAGDTFLVAPDDRTARQIAEKREAAERAAAPGQASQAHQPRGLHAGARSRARSRRLNLILKGDVSGAVEALEDALLKIDVGEEVELRVIHRGVGAITQNDVNLATVDNADHHRLQRQVRRARRGAGGPRGRRRPLLLGHLPGDRRRRGGPQGHAQAGVRGGPARHRRGARGLPVLQVRQHRRLARPVGPDPPQLEGARHCAAARSSATTSRSSRSSGSRTTPPRSARASSAVSASGRSTTSRSATSSRPSRCARSPRLTGSRSQRCTREVAAGARRGRVRIARPRRRRPPRDRATHVRVPARHRGSAPEEGHRPWRTHRPRPQARRPHPAGRRADARHADQGPAPRLRHRHRRPGDRRPPARRRCSTRCSATRPRARTPPPRWRAPRASSAPRSASRPASG